MSVYITPHVVGVFKSGLLSFTHLIDHVETADAHSGEWSLAVSALANQEISVCVQGPSFPISHLLCSRER